MRDQWVREESQPLSRAEGLCGPTHPTGAASRTRGARTRPTEPPAGSLLLLAFCSSSLWAEALSPRLAAAYLPPLEEDTQRLSFPHGSSCPDLCSLPKAAVPKPFQEVAMSGQRWISLGHCQKWRLMQPPGHCGRSARAQPPLAGQVALSPGGCWRYIRAQIQGSLVFTHVTAGFAGEGGSDSSLKHKAFPFALCKPELIYGPVCMCRSLHTWVSACPAGAAVCVCACV